MDRKEFLAKLTELVKSFEGDDANNAFVSMAVWIEDDFDNPGENDNRESFSWNGADFDLKNDNSKKENDNE
jgi:hypothetical protein